MARRRTMVLSSQVLGHKSPHPGLNDTKRPYSEFLSSRVDSALKQLVIDPASEQNEPNRRMRPVLSGHYVHVAPTPLPSPYLVAFSAEMASELDLRVDPNDGALVDLLSGDISASDLRPWCTPYAVSVFGSPIIAPDPFGTGDGYGDGRAVTLGEFVGRGGVCWELQLKGGGSTPFGRGHDGRAVLRSSVREFLVSEAMNQLGISTTRALSLVASRDETVQRAWYPPDYQCSPRPPTHLVEERCAITCRAAPSFIRVGHFELYYRRVMRKQGRETEALAELTLLAAHAIRREFPALFDGVSEACHDASATPFDQASELVTPDRVVGLFRAHMLRQVALVVGWLRVGYVQGNMNSDNCLVGGRTMDYGPFGFMERFLPRWNPFTSDMEGKFGFMRQPHATQVNLVTFARCLVPLLAGSGAHLEELQRIVSDEYGHELDAALGEMRRAKLGLARWDAAVDAPVKLRPLLWDPLESLLEECAMDWTMLFRELASCLEAAAAARIDDASSEAQVDGVQLELLRAATYDVDAFDAASAQWLAWLRDWRRAVSNQGYPGTVDTAADAAAAFTAGAALVRRTSPKYVPREWMLCEAYEAAERGDHAVLQRMQRILGAPYAEHGDDDRARYYQLCPESMRGRAGVSFFS